MMGKRALLYISIAASLIYWLTEAWQPFPGSAELKAVPVAALAVVALMARGVRRDAGLLALGLAFSALGDLLLDLDPGMFVFGLVAFLATHVTYIVLFVGNRNRDVPVGAARWMATVVIVAYAVGLSAWIVPSVGALAVPVVVYVCALTLMASSATLARFPNRWVAVGAVLFLISDSLLAINRFRSPFPLHGYFIWATYYLGQCGIALGFLDS